MNVYKCLTGKIEKRGVRFKIDLTKKDVLCDGKYLVKGGVYDGDFGIPVMETEEALELIEELYESYKYSYPSERSMNRRVRHFIALKLEDLSDYELAIGEDRELAQAKLELTVLGLVLNGSLQWDESWGSWYWQSKKDKNLIILKSWM